MKLKSKPVFRQRSFLDESILNLMAIISMSKQFAIVWDGLYFRCVHVQNGEAWVDWVPELQLSNRFNCKGARHTLANLQQGKGLQIQDAEVRNYLLLVLEEWLWQKNDRLFRFYHRVRQNWSVLLLCFLLTAGLCYTL